MNRTIGEATGKRFHHNSRSRLRPHPAALIAA